MVASSDLVSQSLLCSCVSLVCEVWLLRTSNGQRRLVIHTHIVEPPMGLPRNEGKGAPASPSGGAPGGGAPAFCLCFCVFYHLGIRAGASARATSPTTPRGAARLLRATPGRHVRHAHHGGMKCQRGTRRYNGYGNSLSAETRVDWSAGS